MSYYWISKDIWNSVALTVVQFSPKSLGKLQDHGIESVDVGSSPTTMSVMTLDKLVLLQELLLSLLQCERTEEIRQGSEEEKREGRESKVYNWLEGRLAFEERRAGKQRFGEFSQARSLTKQQNRVKTCLNRWRINSQGEAEKPQWEIGEDRPMQTDTWRSMGKESADSGAVLQ